MTSKKLDIAIAKELFNIKVWSSTKEESLKKRKDCFDYLLDSVIPPFSTSLDTACLVIEELSNEWISDILDFRSPPHYHRWKVLFHQTDGTELYLTGNSLPELICILALKIIRKEYKQGKSINASKKFIKKGKSKCLKKIL